MTDQTKIPLPGQEQATAETGSLIERAVKAFDLSNFAPPPVPQNLAPAQPKPAARQRAEREAAAAASTVRPVVPGAWEQEPNPPIAEPRAPEPNPPLIHGQPQAEPQPEPQPAPEPVRFGSARHPVDRELLRDNGMIVPETGATTTFEEFRIVKRQLIGNIAELRRQGAGAAAQRILITSPHPGEGKTYCAVNLALAFAAEKESDVLIVDADFAKPSVLERLGLPGGRGLMDALADPALDVVDMVIGTDVPGLWVLPAGATTNTDSEYLNLSRAGSVLDRLTAGMPNRLVIFDSPPALAASPAAELARHVGQTVMVVRADRTSQGALEDAVSLLSACPNIQLLLNAVTFSPSGRKFGTYYGYGG